jgi:RNA polymerase sigma-70 factor (ECF subfamily)
MTKINLRDIFPEFGIDCFIEIYDEDMKAYVAAMTVEVAKAYFEEELKVRAFQRKRYRYNAHYSIDRNDGIENDALTMCDDPHVIILRNFETRQIHTAIAQLPSKQSRRIYAHFILGKSKVEIAHEEGVNESKVRKTIERGIESLKIILKVFSD